MDLMQRSILIRAEEKENQSDRALIHVHASSCWEILRTELMEESDMLTQEVSEGAETCSLESFRIAAEKILSTEQLEKILRIAVSLSLKTPSGRD